VEEEWRLAASAISMATILESEAGARRERKRRGGVGVARLGRQWGRRRAVQGSTGGAVALSQLGRPISEKKRKENRNRLGCQGLLGQNQIGLPEENKNCFRFSDSREWASNQKI
jgi:hypothetical protein